MTHPDANLSTVRRACVGRHQADQNHLRGPNLVMVGALEWRAAVVLPEMAHLVRKNSNDFGVSLLGKAAWVERDLVDHGAVVAGGKAVAREVSAGTGLTLERDKCVRKKEVKEPSVQKHEYHLQVEIGLHGRRRLWRFGRISWGRTIHFEGSRSNADCVCSWIIDDRVTVVLPGT